jgi:hypothetical protein
MNVGRRRLLAGMGPAAFSLPSALIGAFSNGFTNQALAMSMNDLQVKLLYTLRSSTLQDISADGEVLLLSGTTAPIQFYTTGEDRANGAGKRGLSELRLVSTQSGESLHRIGIEGLVYWARITAGRRSGFVTWMENAQLRFGAWDTATSKPKLVENPQGLSNVAYPAFFPLTQTTALMSYRSPESDWMMTIVDWQGQFSKPSTKNDPTGEKASSSYPTFSRDWTRFAHVFSGRNARILVRGIHDLAVVAEVSAPLGQRFSQIALNSDGSTLAADAHYTKTGLPRDPHSVHEVHLYDVATGGLLKRFPIDGRDRLAFSADGRLLAVGRRSTHEGKELRVQGVIGIHDAQTGRKLAEVSHPEVVEPRMNPFIGNVSRIEFLADDSHLITSTQDTRVWRIDRT